MKIKKLVAILLTFAILALSASLYILATATGLEFISADNSEYFTNNRYNVKNDSPNGLRFTVGNLGDLRWDRVTIYDSPTGVYNKRWPYIAFKVNAATDGEYTITTKLGTNTATKAKSFNMIVDGISNAVRFTLDSKGIAEPVATLNLTAGEHIIVITSPIPEYESINFSGSNDTLAFPWCDFYSFKLSKGLTVTTAPTVEEINSKVATRVEAEDVSCVLYNLGYGANGTLAKGANRADVKQSFADLEAGLLDKTKMPYIEYRINAAKSGKYNIRLGSQIGGNDNTNLPFATVIVNGKAYKAQYDCNFTSGQNAYGNVNLTVELNEGINILRVTTITNDQLSFEKNYINHDYLELQNGLTAVNVVTKVEAEDTVYATWNIYNKSENGGSGTVVGGVSKGNIKQTYEDLGNYLDKKTTPYIQYIVEAPEDGEYVIVPAYLANTNGNKNVLEKPFATVIVNGDKTYKAQFTTDWNTVCKATLSVELKKGINVIRVTSITPDQNAFTASTWINHDYILLDSNLTPVKNSEAAILNFTDEKITHNIYTVNDDENGLRLGGLSGNYLGDGKLYTNTISNADLTRVPYVAFKVTALKDGYYDMTFNVTSKATDGRTQCVTLFADGETKALKFRAVGASKLDASLYLTSGEHIIVATPPMPESADLATGVDGDDFPWFDYCTLELGTGLAMCEAPTEEEVLCEFKIRNIADENKVLINRFTDNGDTLGNAVLGDMRWDRVSVESLTTYNFDRMPYAALRINAAEDGEYTVKLSVNTNPKATSNNIAVAVDGKENYAASIIGKEASAKIKLTKGEHIIVFTSPMPLTSAEAMELKQDDANAYPWFDMNKLFLANGLEIGEKPTKMQVETPLIAYDDAYIRIEAENADYAVYKGYDANGEKNTSASEGVVVGGVKRWMIEQSFDDLGVWVDGSNGHIAYVEYVVEAPTDGEYDIRVGLVADASKREGVPKPYGAVIVNETVYKAQYNNVWAKSEGVKLTVKLNKGRNIIRSTGLTDEQDIYKTGYWINQDFIDIDKRLTPVKRSSVTAEAEKSEYTNLLKIQDGEADEKASGGKVLGGANTKRLAATEMTLDKFTAADIRIMPYFSYTIDVPVDGYYNMGVLFAGDGRLSKSQFALIVDNEVKGIKYSRNGKETAINETTGIVYLTKGEHTVTVTSPIPADKNEKAVYSYRWINFDCIKFYDGITISKIQKAPTDIPDFVKFEAEEYGLPNFTRYVENRSASGGRMIGGAFYGRTQSANEIKLNGVNLDTMPAVQYTVTAKEAGEYTFFFSQNSGISKPIDTVKNVSVAIECNGNVQIFTDEVTPNVTRSRLICAKLNLKAGVNNIIITHSTRDSYTTEGYAWVDYDYIEIDSAEAKKLTFRKITGIVEAEKSEYEGYTTVENAGASGGKYLGKGTYGPVDLNQITYDKFNPKDAGEMPRVIYTVNAIKEGDYEIAVQFSGGSVTYTFDELIKKGEIGFAVAVNGENKQLVEFCPGNASRILTRIVKVHLKEGPNEILVTAPFAEYMSGVSPRVEENYKLYWMDQDAIILTEGISLDDEKELPGIEDSDINYAQLTVKNASNSVDGYNSVKVKEKSHLWSVIGIISLVVIAIAAGTVAFIIVFKKKANSNN